MSPVFPAFTRTTHVRVVVLASRNDLDIENINLTPYIIHCFVDISGFSVFSFQICNKRENLFFFFSFSTFLHSSFSSA